MNGQMHRNLENRVTRICWLTQLSFVNFWTRITTFVPAVHRVSEARMIVLHELRKSLSVYILLDRALYRATV